MNQDRALSVYTSAAAEAAADPLGRRFAARLNASTAALPYEVSERLRAARVRAVAARKRTPLTERSRPVNRMSSAESPGWLARLASVMPVMALVLGIAVLHHVSDESRANEVAEVDSALLLDALPPGAYTDAGFAQYLRLESDAAE